MIVVTGGKGFIGNNLVRALNDRGIDDIIVVDSDDDVEKNDLSSCTVRDFVSIDDFREMLISHDCPFDIDMIFHQGACTDTTESDRTYMLDINYNYSVQLFEYCERIQIPLIYASSAAVYGNSKSFLEQPEFEKPINVYAESKLLFDNYVRSKIGMTDFQVVGLRYFNVFGPRESHKGHMASVAFHLNRQLLDSGEMRLFRGTDGYEEGEQQRDFVHVDDAVSVNLWFMDNTDMSGVFNVGSGQSRTFNAVAQSVKSWHQNGKIEYIDFPEKLIGKYQSYTQADLTRLRKAGCNHKFKELEKGMSEYLNWLNP
ncbi:MAG: ADP-glyceromanno-heptose 6-epimerase [Gammaproteobacteria bacterium]|nr:ADP-glyceromanno-heptose 6-epimerase [Gammaproteobacteria bacterium]